MCMCPTSSLVNVERGHSEFRTEACMKRSFEQMSGQPRRVQASIAKSHSLHPVQVSLFMLE